MRSRETGSPLTSLPWDFPQKSRSPYNKFHETVPWQPGPGAIKFVLGEHLETGSLLTQMLDICPPCIYRWTDPGKGKPALALWFHMDSTWRLCKLNPFRMKKGDSPGTLINRRAQSRSDPHVYSPDDLGSAFWPPRSTSFQVTLLGFIPCFPRNMSSYKTAEETSSMFS